MTQSIAAAGTEEPRCTSDLDSEEVSVWLDTWRQGKRSLKLVQRLSGLLEYSAVESKPLVLWDLQFPHLEHACCLAQFTGNWVSKQESTLWEESADSKLLYKCKAAPTHSVAECQLMKKPCVMTVYYRHLGKSKQKQNLLFPLYSDKISCWYLLFNYEINIWSL